MTSLSYKKIFQVIMLICIVIVLSTIAAHVYAQVDNTYTSLSPLPDLNSTTLQPATSVGFDTYVQYVFNLLIALGAVAAVFMITWGGFEYMTSDAVGNKTEGLSKVKNAIYGLLLILSSVLIMRTINPQFAQVPLGLVPAANLTQPTQTISAWEAGLNKIANDAARNSAIAAAANNAAKAAADAAQAKLLDVKQKAALGQATANDVAIAQSKVNDANTARALTAYSQSQAYTIHSITSGGENGTSGVNDLGIDSVNSYMVQDNTAYQASLVAINASGGDAAKISALNQSHEATQAQLLMTQNLLQATNNVTTSDQAIRNIQRMQTVTGTDLANSPTLLRQVNTLADTYVAQLKAQQAATDLQNQINSQDTTY